MSEKLYEEASKLWALHCARSQYSFSLPKSMEEFLTMWSNARLGFGFADVLESTLL